MRVRARSISLCTHLMLNRHSGQHNVFDRAMRIDERLQQG